MSTEPMKPVLFDMLQVYQDYTLSSLRLHMPEININFDRIFGSKPTLVLSPGDGILAEIG